MTTASDYDARRVSDPDAGDGAALRDLGSSLPGMSTAVVDEDPNDVPFFELPDGDLTGEELSVAVVPKRADEFTCSCCFLVQHRSRLRSSANGRFVCADCS